MVQRRSIEFCSVIMTTVTVLLLLVPSSTVFGFQSKAEIKVRLATTAQKQFDSVGAHMSPKCRDALDGFIANAAEKVSQPQLDEAERAIRRFADEMIKHSGEATNEDPVPIEGGGRPYLTIKSFSDARGVCPLYPIC